MPPGAGKVTVPARVATVEVGAGGGVAGATGAEGVEATRVTVR